MNNKTQIFHFSRHLLKVTLSLALLLSLTACDGLARFATKPESKPAEPVVTQPPPAPPEDTKPIDEIKLKASPLYEWNGDGRRVSRIVIDTNQQKARFYAGDDEIGWSTVATGVEKYPTPTGQFMIIEKVENKRSNLYGKVYGKGGQVLQSSVKVGHDPIPAGGRFEGSSMPFYLRLTHDGVGLHAGPIPHPGQPASHGCIRMPSKLAPVLFSHVTSGTQVAIVGRGPDYGNYVEKQRAIAAKQAAEQRRIAAEKAAAAASAPQIAVNVPTSASPTGAVITHPDAPQAGQAPTAPSNPAPATGQPLIAPNNPAPTAGQAPTPPAAPLPVPAAPAPTAPTSPTPPAVPVSPAPLEQTNPAPAAVAPGPASLASNAPESVVGPPQPMPQGAAPAPPPPPANTP
jgi:lipoprotein-anchoring transpeptidase ErfK/SrfK